MYCVHINLITDNDFHLRIKSDIEYHLLSEMLFGLLVFWRKFSNYLEKDAISILNNK